MIESSAIDLEASHGEETGGKTEYSIIHGKTNYITDHGKDRINTFNIIIFATLIKHCQ